MRVQGWYVERICKSEFPYTCRLCSIANNDTKAINSLVSLHGVMPEELKDTHTLRYVCS